MNYGIINAKLTTGEMDELMQRRAQGDKLAHDAMYHQAWLLMHFFASQVNAEEHTYTYYKRIDDVLDQYDPKKGGKLSSWIKRSFLSHAKYMRNKPLNKCLSLEYDELGKSLEERLYEEGDVHDDNRIKALWDGLNQISELDAKLVIDRYLQEYSFNDMQERHGYNSPQAAWAATQRALKRLREAMASLEDVD